MRELSSGGRADTKSPAPPLPPSAPSRPAARCASIPAASGCRSVTAASPCAGGRRRQRCGRDAACLLPCPRRPAAAGVTAGRCFRGEPSQFRDRRGGAAARLGSARLGEAARHGAAARHQAAAAAAPVELGTASVHIPVPAAAVEFGVASVLVPVAPVGLSTASVPVPAAPAGLGTTSVPVPAAPAPPEKNQEADAEEAPTVHAVEMSHIPLLMEPACSSSEGQGATKMRNNDAASRLLVPLSDKNESKQPKSIQRKRVLPSWMLETDVLVQRVSKPVMTGGSKKKKGQGRGEGHSESLKSEVHVQQKKRLTSEEAIEGLEGGEQDQGKRSCLSIPVPSSQNASGFPLETSMRDMEGSGKTGTKNPRSSLDKKDRQLHSKCSKRIGQISSKDNRIEETENQEQITGSTSQQAHWGRTSQCFGAQERILEPDAHLDFNTEVSDSARSADASESSKQMQHKRTPCMYGSGCYRKNPTHFQQFSHPSDDDYHDMEVVAQGDGDSRPECPYGTACYRKNPQHKLEYKHSAPPVTRRRTQQQTSSNGKRAVKKDGVNEYDLNDSFIDDEEEEEYEPTDEDSDWEPSSEEKDNEDVETVVQETRKFVRVKK